LEVDEKKGVIRVTDYQQTLVISNNGENSSKGKYCLFLFPILRFVASARSFILRHLEDTYSDPFFLEGVG